MSQDSVSFPTFHTGHPTYFHPEERIEDPSDESHVGDLDLLILSPGVPASSSWLLELQNQVRTHCDKEFADCFRSWFCCFLYKDKNHCDYGNQWKIILLLVHTAISHLFGIPKFCGWKFLEQLLSEMIIEEISNQTSSFDFAVVEISSYQMEFPFGFAPKVGVILNLTPDHLARHKTMDVYAQMKKRIFAAQSKDDFAYSLSKIQCCIPTIQNLNPFSYVPMNQLKNLNSGGYIYIDTSCERETKITCVDERKSKVVYSVPPLQLLGHHNLQNIQAMIGILHSLSLPIESHLLSSIRPLEHRLEIIHGVQQDENLEWINDSKATNVEATMAGLSATVEYIQKKNPLNSYHFAWRSR